MREARDDRKGAPIRSAVLARVKHRNRSKEGEEMPPVFKALASITVWILFVSGCITMLVTTLNWIVSVGLIGKPDLAMFTGWGLASAEFILSVVAAKLRQLLE